MNQDKTKIIRVIFIVLGVFFVFNLLNMLNNNGKGQQINAATYTQFMSQVNDNKIKSAVITERLDGPRQIQYVDIDGKKSTINAPQDAALVDKLLAKKVDVTAVAVEPPSLLFSLLMNFGPIILMIAVWVYFMKKMNGGSKNIFQVTKSRGKLIDPKSIKVGFKDVVGCDEAKLEAQEFVDFLKNPEKFAKLGGRTPRGVLLTGPAGTGKTLLAKALAKESGVPFIAMSGSEFVEMFVGVGAARVRDTFETAKKHAPCVIFIDEIDAIGGKRGHGNVGGGNDEREQTLNQILVEMDGFDTNSGVIVVGATNRPEMLDKALLRPGRFDRQVVVNLPDVNGREQILKVHSKEVPMDTKVDLRKIARGTPGFSGAQLASLINEAAIFAARASKKFVEQEDLNQAKDKIMMGPERPSMAISEADKRETAYHESGHAVVARLMKNADPVYKVTIIPRGFSLGLTQTLPEKDHSSYTSAYLRDKIAMLMGGRAAEEIFSQNQTTGASHDIQTATNIARGMILEYGMSEMGPIAFGSRNGNGFLSNGELSTSGLSQKTLEKVDETIQELLNSQYALAKKLLEDNRDIVEAMTSALMEVETIDDWQIDNLMERRHYNYRPETMVIHTEESNTKTPDINGGKTESGFLPDRIEPVV